MRTADIAWLAGLLEGEACFRYDRGARIFLNMTDLDVMERAHTLLRATQKIACRQRGTNKPIYNFQLASRHAAAWMMTLWPLLGSRRRATITAILRRWRDRGVLRRDGMCPSCGWRPKERHVNSVSGYCRPCRVRCNRQRNGEVSLA